jgi:F-type H+-transporting ATPase subunit c
MELEAMKALAMAVVVGVGVVGPAVGIGYLVGKALEAIGRNPDASGKITTTMFIGVAFTEALAIFALVVGFIIKFT